VKVCIFGAGAIGGMLAVRLAQQGVDVSVVARGAQLEAIRGKGLTLVSGHGEQEKRDTVRIPASDKPVDLGPQDYVILCVKGYGLPQAAQSIAPLLEPDTCVVPAVNGIPWWFFHQWGGQLAGMQLKSCDPHDVLAQAIAPERILGAVAFQSGANLEPGVVRHNSGARMVFGEPSGVKTPRAEALAQAFAKAGFDATCTDNIRLEIWLKLFGNVSFNPVSVLSGVSTDRMIDEPGVHGLFAQMMTETAAIGRAIGLEVGMTPVNRIAMTRKLGRIKTSMLQDVESSRPLEVEAIIGSTVEVGRKLGIAMPFLESVYGLVRLRGEMLGLYKPEN
jgi:2-dehydropantoate 2-reductase